MASFRKDISDSELLQMREAGMTNAEIASRCGVSYQTILNRIGKQPPSARAAWAPNFTSETRTKKEPKEEIPASLIIEDRVVRLSGMFGCYEVSAKDNVIRASTQDGSAFSIPFDKLSDLIAELQAIQRKIPDLGVGNEMW